MEEKTTPQIIEANGTQYVDADTLISMINKNYGLKELD